MKKLILILILSFTMNTQAQPVAVLTKLLKDFTNTRDFTKYNNKAYFGTQSNLGNVSVII